MIKHLEISEIQDGSNKKFIYLILNDLTFNLSLDECEHFKYFELNNSIMYRALCFKISKDDADAIFRKIGELKALYA